MKYILTVSEYMNYRKRLNSLCKMTKYIFEVRLFFCQMISFLLLLMSMMKSSKHDFLAAFRVSICLHLGLAVWPVSDQSAQY